MRRLALLLCLAMVALAAVGCGGSKDAASTTTEITGVVSTTPGTTAGTATTTTPETPPLIDAVAAAPTRIDGPYIGALITATPETEMTTTFEGVALSIPAGAVSSNTIIEIRRLAAPFNMEEGTEATAQNAAFGLGQIYDLGPQGLVFDKPVTVTLPYEESALPAHFSEADVGLAYWDGQQWFACQGFVDRDKNTVTVQFEEFEGIVLTTVAYVALSGIILYTGKVIVEKLQDPERTGADPVRKGTAPEWVTPQDPVVKDHANGAAIWNSGTNETKSLDDPDVADWVAANTKNPDDRLVLVYQNPDGTVKKSVFSKNAGSNWQKPSDYFTTGTREAGPASGDCTDHTNAAVSVFKARGIPAKGVYGYPGGGNSSNAPHAWAEIQIGDRVYRVDDGYIYTPENFEWHFDEYKHITDPSDPYYDSMWDDEGQGPYEEDWWREGEFEGFAGPYTGTFAGATSKERADVPWGFLVTEDGTASGGFDYEWAATGVHDWWQFKGVISETGVLNGSGIYKATFRSSGEVKSTEMVITGQISGEKFSGELTVKATGVVIKVTATRQ